MSVPLHLRTKDGQFSVCVAVDCVENLRNLATAAGARETGGILVGRYSATLETAHVVAASGPPPDSRRGATTFHRGVVGLRAWLRALWSEREPVYYLGEWHFHPAHPPTPSPVDLAQMALIAQDANYRCPEPLLLILGGDPVAEWRLRGFVCLGDGTASELFPVAPGVDRAEPDAAASAHVGPVVGAARRRVRLAGALAKRRR